MTWAWGRDCSWVTGLLQHAGYRRILDRARFCSHLCPNWAAGNVSWTSSGHKIAALCASSSALRSLAEMSLRPILLFSNDSRRHWVKFCVFHKGPWNFYASVSIWAKLLPVLTWRLEQRCLWKGRQWFERLIAPSSRCRPTLQAKDNKLWSNCSEDCISSFS